MATRRLGDGEVIQQRLLQFAARLLKRLWRQRAGGTFGVEFGQPLAVDAQIQIASGGITFIAPEQGRRQQCHGANR